MCFIGVEKYLGWRERYGKNVCALVDGLVQNLLMLGLEVDKYHVYDSNLCNDFVI